MFLKMTEVLPAGVYGKVTIRHFVPSETDLFIATIRMMQHGRGLITKEPTCQLLKNGMLWMSDTPDEQRDHRTALYKAKGHVLIGGLGLGMIAVACALKPEVTKVTVIEIDPDIIAAVLPHLHKYLESNNISKDKLEVLQANLLTWKPDKGKKYGMAWFDIWPNLCTDNLKEMTLLNRRYGKHLEQGAYRGCWEEESLKRRKQQESKNNKYCRWGG